MRAESRPPRHHARSLGFTLVEMIFVVVILAIGAITVPMAITQSTIASAAAVNNKQALAAAESLLDEVLSRPIVTHAASPAVTVSNRLDAHDVDDYNGFTMDPGSTGGIRAIDNTAIAALAQFSASVTVANAALGTITAVSGDARLVTVTVSGPGGASATRHGYKVNDTPL
jgi:MSHA pilin protein MshD